MRIICISINVITLIGTEIISLFLRRIFPSLLIITGRKGRNSGKTKRIGKLIKEKDVKAERQVIKNDWGGS